jgi:hypothetical protein
MLSGGRPALSPIFPWAPIRVTPEERQAIARARSARPSGFGDRAGSGPGSASLAPEEFPDSKPPFTGQDALTISPAGTIWIATHRAFSDSIPQYDVFSNDGVMRRRVRLPARRTLVGFGRNALYLAFRDPDTDLWFLERWAAP